MTMTKIKEKGLYVKFFVLKLDGSDEAAMKAMLAYANNTPNRILARDLFKLYSKITGGRTT